MNWVKNSYGGFRNEADTLYLQQTPKKYFQVFRRDGEVWALATRESFRSEKAAQAYAEALS